MTRRDDLAAMTAKPWLKIDLGERGQIGPGKIALLKRIEASGSISAAAREHGMSYRRACLLVHSLNSTCGRPVVTTETGSKDHGGAKLTDAGTGLIGLYKRVCE